MAEKTRKAKKPEKPFDIDDLTVTHDCSNSCKLFIPACGDRLVLAEPWTFTLYFEGRNMEFAKQFGLIDPSVNSWGIYEDPPPGDSRVLKRASVTLPAGLIIECDRVYIRTFNKSALKEDNDFDSITWRVVKNGKTVQKLRFWAKLSECLDIQYALQSDSLYRDRVKLIKLVQEG